jgi:tRNA dimethylallyltransferase
MFARGFLEEVRNLMALGYDGALNALQTVGYKEAYDHLAGKLTFDEMRKLIQRNSRRYAKRQLTWFRRDGRITWMDIAGEEEYEELAGKIAREFAQAPAAPRKSF